MSEIEQRRAAWLRRVEEYKREELQWEIAQLEHSTEVVPVASDPEHCELCAKASAVLAKIRKVDA